ncbi:MAG: hypothetical protein QXZ01_02860 [Candidatus Micrarchaeaceae archaeon]
MEKLKHMYKQRSPWKHYAVYAIAGFSVGAPIALAMYAFGMILYGSVLVLAAVIASECIAKVRLAGLKDMPDYSKILYISLANAAIFALYCAFIIARV